MLIGVYLRLSGRPGTDPAPPSWPSLKTAAITAEQAGFDRVVFEDVLLYPAERGNEGVWDPFTVAAAIAAATEHIGIAHAVVNSPYHHPAIIARAAATLDEVSGGRYTLGIGMGSTPADYPRFGIPASARFSRFAESIEVIAGLLRDGHASLEGEFVHMPEGELVLRGPRPAGPPILIAAGKPRMIRLAARHADEWNWWSDDPGDPESCRELVREVDRACEEIGRDPAALRRSIDLFSVAPGATDEIAERILAWEALGFGEARLDLRQPEGMSLGDTVGAMADIVERIHQG